MKLAIATCSKEPHLATSDKPLPGLFAEHGITAEPAIWNDASIDWQQYDGVLIRSVWDYHLHTAEFNWWLNLLEEKKLFTLNPVATIRQNQNKFYLKQLQQKGVDIIPTLFINKTDTLDLSAVKTQGWHTAVIKPAVSASAYLTRMFRATELNAVEQEFKAVAAERELLVQPFIEEINTQGEISLLYFNRSYSHAVIKKPGAGDFRVQKEYGGVTEPYSADTTTIKTADAILRHIKGDLLYARVDGVIINNRFVLMELELIEPFLFLDYKTGAMQQFVAAAAGLFKRKAY